MKPYFADNGICKSKGKRTTILLWNQLAILVSEKKLQKAVESRFQS